MSVVTQQTHNQATPSILRPIEVPDNIPSYSEAIRMSKRLDAYFVRKGISWMRGREAFMFGQYKKKTLDRI
jgi:hypothetical protein